MARGRWRAVLGLLPPLLRGEPLSRMQRHFYGALYAFTGNGGPRFVNFGFAPADPAFAHHPEPFQATLAQSVIAAGRLALGRDPAVLLDVACGRGGALDLAGRAFPAARLIGLDQHLPAMQEVRRCGALAVVGDGLALPFRDGMADLVISVEAMLNLGRGLFLREASRVLAPGGVVAACGSFNGPPSAIAALLRHEAVDAGLVVVRMRDLTPGIVQSCTRDAARRRALMAAAPWPVRWRLRRFVAMPVSPTFRAYAEGRRCFYQVVLRRPG